MATSSRFNLARLLRRQRPSTVKDVESLRAQYEAAYGLSRTVGWNWLTEVCEAEMEACLDQILKPITERERDYYSSRVDTLRWLLTLPRVRADVYATALQEAADNLPSGDSGVWDPSAPVTRED